MKDIFDELKKKLDGFLTKKLKFEVTSWLTVSYQGLKTGKKVVSSYIDLVTDIILLASVLLVVQLTLVSFSLFPSQVAVTLLASIVFPLITSTLIIAFTRPFVIYDSQEWKELSTSKDKTIIWVARMKIILFSIFVPAMTILSMENAKYKLEALVANYDDEEDETAVLKECEDLDRFIREARQEQLQIWKGQL